jgi:hypothetical protein
MREGIFLKDCKLLGFSGFTNVYNLCSQKLASGPCKSELTPIHIITLFLDNMFQCKLMFISKFFIIRSLTGR